MKKIKKLDGNAVRAFQQLKNKQLEINTQVGDAVEKLKKLIRSSSKVKLQVKANARGNEIEHRMFLPEDFPLGIDLQTCMRRNMAWKKFAKRLAKKVYGKKAGSEIKRFESRAPLTPVDSIELVTKNPNYKR
jgi:hypothetical protein